MQEPQHDVIVVGAGFSGLACARELAVRGLRVCVIDRKHDLGERIHTTGILVDEALDDPAFAGLPDALLRPVPHVRLYAPNLRSIRLGAPGYRFHTTDTPALMRWLGERAIRQGVALRLGCGFTGAAPAKDGWHVPGAGRCRYLVGADGVRSRVAAGLGLGRVRDVLYGVEYEYDGIALREPDALHCFISRRYAPGYIGWVAQTPTGVQGGLALRRRAGRPSPPPDLRGLLERVAPMVGLPPRRRPDAVRAGLIPCGGPVARRACDGAVLIGDAAGMVSPVTAGGIHAGLRHGASVGRALADALLSSRPYVEPADAAAIAHLAGKRMLRWAFDHLQWDWPFDLMLGSAPLRRMAEQLYYHRRGHAVPDPDARDCAGSRPGGGTRLQ